MVACVEATAVAGGAAVTGGAAGTAGAAVAGGAAAVTGGYGGGTWDLQAEGYQRGEGIDLVAPAELSPNGNRCPLGSIPCRPQGPPICTQSPARIVPPCTGDTRADRYS